MDGEVELAGGNRGEGEFVGSVVGRESRTVADVAAKRRRRESRVEVGW